MTKKQTDYKKIAGELAAEVAHLTDALQRERADAMNVRRRSEEDRLKLGAQHKALVIEELLPVIDNFERALKHVPDDLKNNDYIKGIGAVVKQFEVSLKKLGVTRIKTVGETFDPHYHEAVSHEPGDGQQDIVSEELQAGYVLGDHVLRHAMVRVKS
jgi:molecular chaperone GrpE